MQISRGWGDFSLTHNHLVPGLPHLSMYNREGASFANLYFGDAAEVAAERNLDLRSGPGGNHRLEPPLPSAGPWTNWNTQPEIRGFYAVAATASETVAAGIHGLVATRAAATGVWHTQTLAGGRDFRAVAYAHGQYVAVGEGGNLLNSPDGLTWTARDSTVTNNLLGVFWDGRQYLVGGDRGTLLASPDGITWTKRDSGSQISLSGFAYSGTRYVAVGNDGIIISDDALAWRKPANWVEVARVPFTACTWTGNEFVACGLGLDSLPTIYTSPDGLTWTLRESTITASFRAAITLNGSIYLAGDNIIAQSTDDGATWTNIFPATSGSQLFMGLATDGRFLIAAGFSPNIWVLPAPTGLASAETWSPTLAPGEKPDLAAMRNDIKIQLDAGNYAAALQRQLWYFNHALENGELNPIRTTFGIMYWAELGRRYPKAQQALLEIRDRDAREFYAPGGGGFDLFMEVAALNRELSDAASTCALFKQIRRQNPPWAVSCYGIAVDALLHQGEYALCRSYLADPQTTFENLVHFRQMNLDRLNDQAAQREQSARQVAEINHQPGITNLPTPPDFTAAIKKSYDESFVNSLLQAIEIYAATGSQTDAQKIRDEALAVLDDPRLRSALPDIGQNPTK